MNPLVERTESPPIPAVQAWGRAYDGARGPLIDLCQAVPGYAPHPELLRRLGAAASDPLMAKYGFIPGDDELRQVFAADTGVEPGRVAITAGCNQAFFATLLTLAPRGSAVLLPTPWYYNHKMTCDMLGLEARALPTEPGEGFVPDPDRAEALMAGVSAVALVSPNNPTGAIYPDATLEAFAAICRRHGTALLLDQTYRDFAPASTPPEDAIRLYSFSKAYAVPGHRVGAVTLPRSTTMPQLAKVLDCLHICPQRPAQAALAWAIEGLREWREANRRVMQARIGHARGCFADLPDWRIDSLGVYFAYLRHPFPGVPAWEVTELLAREHGVMLLPAPAFAGSPDHLRVSLANIDMAGITALAARLAAVPRNGAAPPPR